MLVAGVMSGTSADGIDVALVEITGIEWSTKVRLVAHRFVPYPPKVRKHILQIAGGEKVSTGEISQLNVLLGELYANAISITCKIIDNKLNKLKLIGSHGQTIYHQPTPSDCCGIPTRSTFQIGESAIIAERTGVATVADFRPADMAAGGQGAPLVPFFDYLYYRHAKIGRVVLNIGGIANLTAIPAKGAPEDVIAFDTGPGNMLMDGLAGLATSGKVQYDKNGQMAATGEIDEGSLSRLMKLPYFVLTPPKSTGREQYSRDFLKKYFFKGKRKARTREEWNGLLATATAFTAESIAAGIAKFVLPKFAVHECVVSGGGVKNRFLMTQLKERLSAANLQLLHPRLKLPRNFKISVNNADNSAEFAQAKEAVAFAVLAYHTYHGRPANIPAATGAKHVAILGKIFPWKKAR